MTSGHPVAADVFLFAGTVLFLAKFWTWEDAKQQAPFKKWALRISTTLVAIALAISTAVWNHKINSLSSAPREGVSFAGAAGVTPVSSTSAQQATLPQIHPLKPSRIPKKPTISGSSNVPEIIEYATGIMVVANNSSEHMFALRVAVKTNENGASNSYALNTELPPKKPAQLTVGKFEHETTLPPMGTDWGSHWRNAELAYPGCVKVWYFTPTSIALRQVIDHYAAAHLSLPLGDAVGTLHYRAGDPARIMEVTFHLKAVLAKEDACPH